MRKGTTAFSNTDYSYNRLLLHRSLARCDSPEFHPSPSADLPGMRLTREMHLSTAVNLQTTTILGSPVPAFWPDA